MTTKIITIRREQRPMGRLPEFRIICGCGNYTDKAGTRLSESLRLAEATDRAQQHNGSKHNFSYMIRQEG